MSAECIGIVAGSGQFPRLAADEARAAGCRVAVCGFREHTDPELAVHADAFELLHLGQLNRLIAFFREQGVRRLCLAGAIDKPRALQLRPDLRAVKLMISLRGKGDDALLRAVIGELEAEGFEVVSAASLIPSLRCPPGVLTRRRPDIETWEDVCFGWPVAVAVGRFDVGQCLVVRRGMVAAVECLEGTDATLRRGSELAGPGCTAIKTVKPGQEERADLPSVGLETVRLLVEHRFACLAVGAETTLFFDRAEALALADRHGLCVLALSRDQGVQLLTASSPPSPASFFDLFPRVDDPPEKA